MADVTIDYDEKTSRFHIHSPPWFVDKMRAIPNRRWDAKRKVWTAPALRANIEYLTGQFKPEQFTLAASNRVVEARTKREVVRKKFPLSYEFKLKPMLHQLAGLDRVYGLNNYALFMQQRTGKTKIVIDDACAHNANGEVELLVIVCLNSLKINWQVELEKNSTREMSVHTLETSKKKDFDKWVGDPHPFRVLIVAVESLAAGSAAGMVERAMLTSIRAMMVIDESHKIKNHSANRSKVCVELGKMATRRAILTGTPSANGFMDYFMQFEFLDPDIIGIGDFYSYRNRYAVMGGYDNKQIIGYDNIGELMELITPYVYQVQRKDVFFDLPDKEYEIRTVQMSKEQAKVYDSLRKSKKANIGSNESEVQNALTLMGRLQEVTANIFSYGNPNYDGVVDKVKYKNEYIGQSSPKVDELLTIAEEEEGSIIIWAVYDKEIDSITKALREKFGTDSVVEVHGRIAPEERDYNVRQLFQKKKARFLVGNAATGAAGHEMSAAEIMVYMTNSFNYVDRSQSEDRASSSQQKNVVKVIDILCEGTVDFIAKEALDNKQDLSTYASGRIKEIMARV